MKITLSRILFVALVVVVAGLTAVAFPKYSGNPVVFLLFSLSANLMLIYEFRKNGIFFDKLFSLFLWLGFWVKFTLRLISQNGYFFEVKGDTANFDNALLISTVAFVAIMLASWVREKRIFKYPQKISGPSLPSLYAFYIKHRSWGLGLFLLAIVAIPVANFVFGIYQRGEIPQTKLPFGLNGIFTWMLMFGLASGSALILRFELELNKKTTFLPSALALLETFFSSASMLSRAMILNVIALGYGLYAGLKAYSYKTSAKYIISTLFLTVVLVGASVSVVNYIRQSYFADAYVHTSEIAEEKASRKGIQNKSLEQRIQTVIAMSTPLLVDRWVGIEGVLAILVHADLGWALWNKAWAEKYSDHQITLYDQIIQSPYVKVDTSKNHFVNLPGIVAFLFYPGSYVFLFFSLFAVVLTASLLELCAFKLGGKNFILSALIAQIIVFRLTNFGYVPGQSYLLFGTIIMNLILIYMADKLLSYKAAQRQLYSTKAVN